jgi:hypothetical protein
MIQSEGQCEMSQKHRTYREIRQEFSLERQQKISAGAARINTRLENLNTVRFDS